ncbi:MAG: TetR/AcrR family transcriptional regulator [Candidatus Kapaibacterium sp.]|jgi:AcrR family transcriptional regulator|nr:TetR/AcrR family transcriptional regulator [Candidatus Kapabacteria bacterium]
MNTKEDLKFRILKIAENNYRRNGYKNLKIDEIVSELGISKRTFYEIFRSKQELVSEIIEKVQVDFNLRMKELIHKMTHDDENHFVEDLKSLWNLIVEHTSYFNRDLIEDLKLHLPGYWSKCAKFDEDRVKDFRKIYKTGIKHGYIKPKISEEIFYIIHFHALKNLLKPEIINDLPLTVNEILSNFYEIILMGALTDEAVREYNTKIRNNQNVN